MFLACPCRGFAVRAAFRSLLTCMLASLLACSDAGSGSSPHDAGTDALACDPESSNTWPLTWRAPRAPTPGACTDLQITDYANRCLDSSPDSDVEACYAIQRDPANSICLKCLFSTVQDERYGPIVIGWDRRWYANVGGCMALIDGDRTENGCGAKDTALQACRSAACTNCTTSAALSACWRQAGSTVCKSYFDDAVCQTSPEYSSCTDYSTFDEYLTWVGALFCSTGFGVAPEPT